MTLTSGFAFCYYLFNLSVYGAIIAKRQITALDMFLAHMGVNYTLKVVMFCLCIVNVGYHGDSFKDWFQFQLIKISKYLHQRSPRRIAYILCTLSISLLLSSRHAYACHNDYLFNDTITVYSMILTVYSMIPMEVYMTMMTAADLINLMSNLIQWLDHVLKWNDENNSQNTSWGQYE